MLTALSAAWNDAIVSCIEEANNQGEFTLRLEGDLAAEYLLAVNVGGVLARERSEHGRDGVELRFTRLALISIGYSADQAESLVAEVAADLGTVTHPLLSTTPVTQSHT